MSDETELRDRIAHLLWQTEEKSWEDQAQAIIDDLGLTVEQQSVAPAYDGGFVYYNTEAGNSNSATGMYVAGLPVESRVVGRWGQQPNHTTNHANCGCV